MSGQKMQHFIQKSMAMGLLLLFVLSNTPTRVLHHLFADHTDFVHVNVANGNDTNIHSSGLNCHCYTNVVIAPYLASELFTCPTPRYFHHQPDSPTPEFPAFRSILTVGLRAPPSA